MSDYRVVGPPPIPPRARAWMFPLALEVVGVDVVTTRSRRMYVLRGLLGILVLPPAFAMLVGLIASGLTQEDVRAADDTRIVIWAMLAAASVVWGLVLIFFSGPLSRRGSIRFDRSRGVVCAEGREEPFAGLEVHVRRLEGISGWNAIELRRGPQLAATVHDRLQPTHATEIATHVEYLARLLGDAPIVAAPDAAVGAAKKYAIADNTAAMLCYLPIQGIHLIASLYYLYAARDRPFVRFAAKQSLLQLGFTFVVLIVVCAGLGVPLALISEGQKEISPAAIVLMVLLAVSLFAIAIGNIVAHIVACVRAQRGQAWVIPWLRPIASRWLPNQPPQP